MKWFTSEPPTNIPILCKFKDGFSYPCFYICIGQKIHEKLCLVEAYGEQYFWWEIDDLVAWTTFEELEKDSKNALIAQVVRVRT